MVTRPAAIIPLILLVIIIVLALQMVRNHLAFTQLETEVSFWGRGDYMPTDRTRQRTGAQIEQLVQAAPKDANVHVLQASQLAWEGYWQQDSNLTQQAVNAQEQALNWRPAHPQDQQISQQYKNNAGADSNNE